MKTFLLTMSLLAALNVQAQFLGSDTQTTGIVSTVSIFNHTYRGSLSPYVSLNYGPKSLTVGPLLLVTSNVGSDLSNGPKLTGLRAAYQFSPLTQSKRFEFYLGTAIQVQRIKDVWQANAFDPGSGNFRSIGYESEENIVECYTGYGIRLKIGNKWFLSNGVGAGVYNSKLHGSKIGSEMLETDNLDYRGYDDFGFSWNVTLGAGYKF